MRNINEARHPESSGRLADVIISVVGVMNQLRSQSRCRRTGDSPDAWNRRTKGSTN